MEVILLEKIRNLGDLGEQVKVKNGYGRNYLLPHGKAVAATASNVAKFEERRAELEAAASANLAAAQKRAEQLAGLKVTLSAQAGDEGKLYGSVAGHEIAEAVTAAGVEIQKSEVDLPEGPLRQVGEYTITLQLHTDVVGSVELEIVASAD